MESNLTKLTKSKYLDYFVSNQSVIRAEAKLIGDLLLVEKIVFPEKKIGSLIMADMGQKQLGSMLSDMPTFYRVLLTGEGYYNDETGEDVPVECKPGDIILTGSASVRTWSSFPILETSDSNIIGLTRYSDVQWHFESEETFIARLNHLNQAIKGAVVG